MDLKVQPISTASFGRRTLLVCAALVVCLSSLYLAPAIAQTAVEQPGRRVFVLQSYHLGDLVTENMQRGLTDAFTQSGLPIEMFVEAMDTNRLQPGEPYYTEFSKLLQVKYASVRFDAVIACENDALEFLRVHRDTLFPGVPVVFTGINDFHRGMLDGRSDITGIAENRDMLAAVTTMLKVKPRVKHIVAIADDTATGRAERATLEAVIPRIPAGIDVRFLSLGDLTLEELGDRLAALRDDSAILLVHGSVDRLGYSYSRQQTTRYLSRRAAVPVFAVSDVRVGLGALGGLVTSGHAAGLTAGQMAISIIRGVDLRNIPVIPNSPTRYLFDYTVMRRFGVSEDDLPEGSIVVNRPLTILDQYRNQVIGTSIAFLVVTAFLVALAFEVLRRRRVEASLRKSQTALAGILNSVPQGVFWKDLDGVYLGCNETFAKEYGFKDSSLVVGKTDFELIQSPEEAKAYRADDAEVVRQRLPKRHIIERLRKVDGSVAWSETTKVPLTDAHGRIYGVLGIYDDITDRKNAEEERAGLLDQLQQAAKMEAVGRLAGGVAHDFNNLLTAISGNLELAREAGNSPATLDHHLDEVQKAADSAAALTRQLLAFSRKQVIEPKIINLNELIGHLQKMLARMIGEDITLRSVLAPDLGSVKVDPALFENALVNLVVNARDAMPDGGTLLIQTSNVQLDDHYCASHPQVTPGPFVLVAVTDTGKGMTAEVKSHLFEPFFTTKSKERGTGLGLATTFGSITQMGGSIEVQSEVGMGTTFKIYIPRVAALPTAVASGKLNEHLLKGSEHVLLVEDDASVRELTVLILKRLGYAVWSAPNGEEALKFAAEEGRTIDLLITDVIMPGMNGRELAQRLAAICPKMKILFASGYAEDVVVHRGLVDEQVNFIAKPYSMQALAAKIRQVLE